MAAVAAAIALLVAFGVPISDDQKVALLGAVSVIAPLLAAAFANPRVTSVADPRDPETGSPLVRRSDGQPTNAATRAMAKR